MSTVEAQRERGLPRRCPPRDRDRRYLGVLREMGIFRQSAFWWPWYGTSARPSARKIHACLPDSEDRIGQLTQSTGSGPSLNREIGMGSS